MILHARSDWTDTPAADAHRFDPSAVMGVVVHWNGPAVPLSALTDPRSYLEGVRRYHVATNGWSDIAYNLAVDQRGHLWTLRGLRHWSAANGDETVNARWVAVLGIIGQGQEPSEAMLDGISQAVALVRDAYPQATKIKGHRDVRPEPTACPGPDLYRAVNNGRLIPTRRATQEDIVLDTDITKIADAVADKLLDDRLSAFVDRVRRGVQGELGDENVGELSDRVAAKVAAAITTTPAAPVDVAALADAVAERLAQRLAD